jgi:hypothetical protein
MNLLLIDSSIREFSLFTNSINSNTLFISYDYTTDTISDILLRIQSLNQTSFTYLGIVFEDDTTYNKLIAINEPFLSFNEQNQIIPNNVTSFIKTLVNTYSITTIDFLACNLLSYPLWHSYFDYLITDNNIFVRASNNLTGNLSIGGDWVLETTNENIRDLYFTEEIGNWNFLLDGSLSFYHNIVLDRNGNMYFVGNNLNGCFGTSSTAVGAVAQTFTLNTDFPSSPSRKIMQICTGLDSLNSGVSWLITNEPTNNFYTCGRNTFNGLLGINSFTSNDTRNLFSNKYPNGVTDILPAIKIDLISLSMSSLSSVSFGILISNESTNNIYLLGNYYSVINNPTFSYSSYATPTKIIDINSSDINGKKIIKAIAGGSLIGVNRNFAIFAITDENTNNLYIHGSQFNYQLGNNNNSTNPITWTNGCIGNSLQDKKILDVISFRHTTFVITDEATNNLYVTGSNTTSPISFKNGTSGDQTTFTNNAFIGNPFSSVKVLGVSTGKSHTFVWTNEPVNNLYYCGYNQNHNTGAGTIDTNTETTGFTKNFRNTPFLNKKVIYAKAGDYGYILTNEPTNNVYTAGTILTGNNGLATGRSVLPISSSTSQPVLALQTFGKFYVN